MAVATAADKRVVLYDHEPQTYTIPCLSATEPGRDSSKPQGVAVQQLPSRPELMFRVC